MATLQTQQINSTKSTLKPNKLGESSTFDLVFNLLGLWFIIGLYLDGWAHSNLPETEETFFTPWHAVFYSGFAITAAVLFFSTFSNLARGYSIQSAIPTGYRFAALGVVLFILGGILDMMWHTFIGIETDLEALFSPTHLLLLLGAVAMTGGTLVRGTLKKDLFQDFKSQVALGIGTMVVLAWAIFFTQFAHPMRNNFGTEPNVTGDPSFTIDGIGIISFVWQVSLLLGFVFYLTTRYDLKRGIVGIPIFGSIALVSSQEPTFHHLISAVIVAVIVDTAYQKFKENGKLSRPQIFGFITGLTFSSTYFAIQALFEGIRWSIDLWTGAIVVSSMVGVLVSFVFYPIDRDIQIIES